MTHIADEKKDLRRGIDHIGVSASFVVHDGKGRISRARGVRKCHDVDGGFRRHGRQPAGRR